MQWDKTTTYNNNECIGVTQKTKCKVTHIAAYRSVSQLVSSTFPTFPSAAYTVSCGAYRAYTAYMGLCWAYAVSKRCPHWLQNGPEPRGAPQPEQKFFTPLGLQKFEQLGTTSEQHRIGSTPNSLFTFDNWDQLSTFDISQVNLIRYESTKNWKRLLFLTV